MRGIGRPLPAASILTGSSNFAGIFSLTRDFRKRTSFGRAGWNCPVTSGQKRIGICLRLLMESCSPSSNSKPKLGNNFNNRTEEALGNATDLWAAYREGAFKPSGRPWLGYVFILEDCPKSQSPVRVKQPHFSVFDEFQEASYAKRYEILMIKLLRERLYDGASLLLTTKDGGQDGNYKSPSEEINFRTFATGLTAHAIAYAKMQ